MILGVLSSPHFLMRVEKNSPSGAPDAYDLAARLSYFLWTSMPDEALFAAAGEGNLHELEQLEKQARRMLRDPKSKALAEHFGGPWMRLGAGGRGHSRSGCVPQLLRTRRSRAPPHRRPCT